MAADNGASASRQLAGFAARLRYEEIPVAVLERARACIIDTLACCVHGASLPWSAATAAYARRYGGNGPCTLFGVPAACSIRSGDPAPATPGSGVGSGAPAHAGGAARVGAPAAALANGAAAHAFEQDSLRFPGAGVHPGATLVPALVAACQETGANGRQALTAFVAACEVLFRIGAATHHSSEKLGFHAPGLTGPYGAAIAAGLIHGLDADCLTQALGIAGSLSAGLLAFTKAGNGAMVKRLHLGRASEAGVVAAALAGEGYEGPDTILEGRYGFLETYCSDGEPGLLTRDLGDAWETLKICFKRYPCHVTAQAPIQALRGLMAQHGFGGADIDAVALGCSEKIVSHHDIRAPADIMAAQYSVPFCVALAQFRDPEDPAAFDADALRDTAIRQACERITLTAQTGLPSAWSANLTLRLRDGRTLTTLADGFLGLPSQPLSAEDQRRRFLLRTSGSIDAGTAGGWYERLQDLENQAAFPVI
ncbi:MmgE/PrpD family protein [Bordetella sp. LUAb4]|uniref:MmgE/PrpD family protein n=1 Tax=Bordetella sp. LUAb4 TaxID=2843195 RepID=UPI001E383931